MSGYTTSIGCPCKGMVHDADCWTRKPTASWVSEIHWETTYTRCSCGYRGMHNLPYHLWRHWFPNVSWLRSTWGDQP